MSLIIILKSRFVPLVMSVCLFVTPINFVFGQQNRQMKRETNSAQTQREEKRIALVIGNGNYMTAPKLINPPRDAQLIAATLRDLGFELIGDGANVNKSQREMKQLMRDFGLKLRDDGAVGLFYYAGHGVQSKGHNFLIPVNADILTEADIEDQSVDINYALGLMDEAANGLNIVILDACRNNPFARSVRSAGDGLAQVRAPSGTLIAYATAPGDVASDGDGQNSPYTEELVKRLKEPDVLIETTFRRVTESVSSRTKGKQEPWVSANIKGEFYFKKDVKTAKATGMPARSDSVNPTDAATVEREAWALVKDSSDPEDIRTFLKEFQNGANAGNAKIRLEQVVWERVKNSKDKKEFEAYLNEFPQGSSAPLARIKLRQLETPTATNNNPTNTSERNTTKPTSSSGKRVGELSKNSLGIEFVYIPAGIFQMGSSESNEADEKPIHQVTISNGFELGRYEVTQGEWKAVMGGLPTKCDSGSLSGDFVGDRNPIICVSWDDAQQFISKLNARNDGYEYRLPTEAEWEYAGRAGPTKNNKEYLDSLAWYKDNSENKTHPVGKKKPNGWGLYDMYGNVWEWCNDWYDENFYSKSPGTDPTGPKSGSCHVVRGGSWYKSASRIRLALRTCGDAFPRNDGTGFRLLRTPS